MGLTWAFVASFLVAALSVTASVHAIMTRKEAGTAVAWVGLIWLSPVVGAVVYFLLGVSRIRRRAQELRGAMGQEYFDGLPAPVDERALREHLGRRHEHIMELAFLGNSVNDQPLLSGNSIRPLVNGDETFPAMIEAIENAERSISMVTYIFDNDRAGKRFVEAFARAQARGVEVRVLIDDVGARYSFPSILGELRRAGITTGRFNPALLHWKMPYFNLRNHRKIMVVDGKIGFTGGINIREGFWEELTGEHHGDDLHFKMDGPVVSELQEVFVQDWKFSTGERLTGDLWFPPLESAGSIVARAVYDGPDIEQEKLHTLIVGGAAAAEYNLVVVTPYFIPDQRLQSALAIAARRGVDVTIILPEQNNLVLVEWASMTYWQDLVDAGCRIMLTPPPFDHTKLMIVDGAWTLMGSANLDPRSLQLNFELNVETFDAEFARRLRPLIDARLERGRQVTMEEIQGRPFFIRFRNRLARLLSAYL